MITIKFEDLLLPANLEAIETTLERDGTLIYPTDTLYGLGGNIFSEPAIQKIDKLKERLDMPYSAAVADFDMLGELTAKIPAVFEVLYPALMPGKFTFLFKPAPGIPGCLLKGSDKIGVRIPGIPSLLQLIKKTGIPLVSTSVNRSGFAPLKDPGRIRAEFPGADILVDAGVLPESRGSTIIDLTHSPLKVIRRGDDFSRFEDLDIAFEL